MGRVFPGCALAGDQIYCYGGYIGQSNDGAYDYTDAANEIVALDLAILGDFSVFDHSNIHWVNKSNTLDGNPLDKVSLSTGVSLSDGSVLFFGGTRLYNPNNDSVNHNPFIHYNPQTNTLNSISLPNNTYSSHTNIVNIGDDKIWMWGGLLGPNSLYADFLNVFDYKASTWPIVGQTPVVDVSLDHTATLVNGLIYIIGGGFKRPGAKKEFQDFRNFSTYNTTSGQFANFRTNGTDIESRVHHSTVLTDDGKYLLIYGGIRPKDTNFDICTDVYYIYDIAANHLASITVPSLPDSSSYTRFGHYSTIYKKNYLLLVFGYSSLNASSNSIDVLNVQDPRKPTWVALPTANSNSTTSPQSSGPDLKTIVPAVVVPVVIALLGIAVGLFLFIRHRKRKQKKAFVLEQEDPRRTLDSRDYGDLVTEGTTVVKSNASESHNDNDIENMNSLMVQPLHRDEEYSNDNMAIKMEVPDYEIIKPFSHTDSNNSSSHTDTIKPSEKS
ncbi:hypothetical protein BJ944DRAFT_229424 [Cunninghamella echinulata]|nr:hypothetical protein BJ944DRAFT_229424 [Cunninghamella echinulata]